MGGGGGEKTSTREQMVKIRREDKYTTTKIRREGEKRKQETAGD